MTPEQLPQEEQTSPDNLSVNQRFQPSLIFTAGYLLFLAFVPSFVVGSLFTAYAKWTDITDISSWYGQIDVIMALTFALYFLVVPSVLLFTKWSVNESKDISIKTFLNIHSPSLHQLSHITLITSLFWLAFTGLAIVLDIPEEPFMITIRNADISVMFVLLVVCITAPIVEELVFRGFLFSRLEQSPLGLFGAIFITSSLFAIVHSQYTMIGVAMVFLLGLYFAWMRVKYRNVVLCMWAHGLSNSLTMIALYQFT